MDVRRYLSKECQDPYPVCPLDIHKVSHSVQNLNSI